MERAKTRTSSNDLHSEGEGREAAGVTAFRFEAARTDGALVRGEIEAASGAEAAALLSARGLYPIGVRHALGRSPGRRRVPTRDQAVVFQSLASLVEAGVPLDQALRTTEELIPLRLRGALARIGARVREGCSLGAALAEENGIFSAVTVGLVRAGERGVGLSQALQSAAAQLEREAETIARVRAALAYPALLAVVGAASVSVIVLFVVPRFAAMLAEGGQSLPPATRVLLAAASAVRRFGILLGVLFVGSATVAVRLTRERRCEWHAWLLGLPLAGPIRHSLATARVSRTLGALLGTGTPALAALAIARDAAADAAVAERLMRAQALVAEGTSLSMALSATGALSASTLPLVSIGERSGRLAGLLAKAAELEDRQGERRLRMLVALLEPALILAFAALVAFVAAALLQAVYSLRPSAG